jgi:hypothetical protein
MRWPQSLITMLIKKRCYRRHSENIDVCQRRARCNSLGLVRQTRARGSGGSPLRVYVITRNASRSRA